MMLESIIAGYSTDRDTESWIVSDLIEYSRDQPRDKFGRWSRVGGVRLSVTYTPEHFSPMSKADLMFSGSTKPCLRIVEDGKPSGSLHEGSLAASPSDLPPSVYHVTVNAGAVKESGKLLAQSDAGGLGGGIMSGVSLTKSKDIADNIALHLLRATSLVREAKTVDDAKQMVNGWARADEDDLGLEQGSLQRPVDEMFFWYEFQEEHHPQKNGSGGINTSTMLEAYTHALMSFEMDGGRQNPIIFGATADKYAKIRPSDISVVEIPAADVFESGGAVVDRDDFLQEVRVYGDIPVANSSFSIVDDRHMDGTHHKAQDRLKMRKMRSADFFRGGADRLQIDDPDKGVSIFWANERMGRSDVDVEYDVYSSYDIGMKENINFIDALQGVKADLTELGDGDMSEAFARGYRILKAHNLDYGNPEFGEKTYVSLYVVNIGRDVWTDVRAEQGGPLDLSEYKSTAPELKGTYDHKPISGAMYDYFDAAKQQAAPGENAVGMLKDRVAKNLSQRAGVTYQEANDIVGQWARTTNGEYLPALAVQKAAAEEFGTSTVKWQEEQIADLQERRNESFTNRSTGEDQGIGFMLAGDYMYPYEQGPHGLSIDTMMSAHRDALEPGWSEYGQEKTKTILREMYAQTQEDLESAGIETVTVYRGTNNPDVVEALGFDPQNPRPMGSPVRVKLNPLSSWSTDPYIASVFGGTVVVMTIPRERVFCTPMTGFGCLAEAEVVVLGDRVADMIRFSPTREPERDEFGMLTGAFKHLTEQHDQPLHGSWTNEYVEDAAFELKHPRSKIGRFAKKGEHGGNGADSTPQKPQDRLFILTDEQEDELLRQKDVYVSADDENKTLGYILNPFSIEDVVKAWQKFPRYKQQIAFLYDPKTGAIMFPEVPVSGTHAGVYQALFSVPQRAARSEGESANKVRAARLADRLVHLYIKTDSDLEPKSVVVNVGYAGEADVNDDKGKERAYKNVYKALDRLRTLGMPADTPVHIVDYSVKGFGVDTTIKEAMADFNALGIPVGSMVISEDDEFEKKHPRGKAGRFAKKNERAGTVGPENYDTVVQGALSHLEGYGPYCSGHTLGDSYPGVEELKWTERYDGLRGWYVSWKNIIDVYGDNPREYIDNLPENLLAVFESGDPEDDESDGGVWFTDVGDRDKFHTGRSTGLVDRSSEFYKGIAEENRTGIDEWAYGRGDRWINTPRNTCSELVAQAMDTYVGMADLSINIGVRTLLKVLDNGEFENQHSVGDSGGCYNPDLRRWLEDRNFGIADKLGVARGSEPDSGGMEYDFVADPVDNPEDYPIYGHFEIPYEFILHPPDYLPKSDVLDAARTYFARQEYFSRLYGDIQVILKTSVKDRTTFTVGDSLDNRYAVVPSEVGNAGVESMYLRRLGGPTSIEESVRNLDIESVLANPLLIGESDDNERRSYVEAQIHGGVLLSDIKEVVVRLAPGEFIYGGDRTSTELGEKLKELEIPYRVVTTTEPEFEDALRRVGADDHFISVFSY